MQSDNAEWFVAVGNEGKILTPFLLRPLPHELDEHAYDAISPYGFAGTYIAPHVSSKDLVLYRSDLLRLYRQHGVVSEFQRFNPFVGGLREAENVFPQTTFVARGAIVAIDTTKSQEAILASFAGRTRTTVRKAEKLGYSCEIRFAEEADVSAISQFRTLYSATMKRADALPYYFFSDEYFQELLSVSPVIADARDKDGNVGASALFLRGNKILHYHLSGATPDAAKDGATVLLLSRVASWCSDNEVELMNLGSGLSPEDDLFTFKTQFSAWRYPFVLAQTVVDPPRYEEFLARRAENLGVPMEKLTQTDYFPPYGAPKEYL